MQRCRPPTLPGQPCPPPGRQDPPQQLNCCDDGTAARWRRSPVTTTMSMPAIDIGALFIGWEDWEGNDRSGIVTEDDDDTNPEWRLSSADFGKGVLEGGGRQQRRRRRAGTTSTKKTS